MAFLGLDFPRRIAFSAQRAPTWSTSLAETFNGRNQANQEWAHTRHEYDVSFAIRKARDYLLVVTHFHEARGRLHWFRFRDPLDNACTASTGVATLISGSTYQLGKTYGEVRPYVRRITRPVTGTATFYRTSGDSPTVRSVIVPTVDYETGQIIVADHEDGDTYQWAGTFDVPTMYAADAMPAAVPDRHPGGELLVSCDSIMLIERRE